MGKYIQNRIHIILTGKKVTDYWFINPISVSDMMFFRWLTNKKQPFAIEVAFKVDIKSIHFKANKTKRQIHVFNMSHG